MNNRILLVEDSEDNFRLVQLTLGALIDLDWAPTLSEGRAKIAQNEYAIVLLDIELPDGNGIDLCGHIQSVRPGLPVFLLTAHDHLSEKVLGFSAGADDYITKPFNPFELRARVEAKLKKNELLKMTAQSLKWKEIEINHNTQEVLVRNQEKLCAVDLTALEYKLLTFFANHYGHVIPRQKILDSIWGEDFHVYSRSVDTHISKVRKKLGPVSHIIESVHGTGYKFCPHPA